MKTLDPTSLLSALQWRYATKAFDPTKKISDSDWAALEKALVLTPSSYGLQPWKFLVITNPELRESLVPHSWNQRQVADCSHFVVFAIKKNLSTSDVDAFLQSACSTRNLPADALAPYRNMILSDVIHGQRSLRVNEWASKQIYIALGNFLTCAALLGIDTCPMEGFDPAKYDEILGLPARGLSAVCACPAGYRSETDKYASLPKVRFPLEEVIERIS